VRRALPFAILGACLVVGVLPALAADQSVAIHDLRFAPVDVAVMPGETVTWNADGVYMHNVHFDGETTAVGPASTKFSASRTFTEEGTFGYHCDVHATMHGVVYVNQSGTVPPPPPTPTPTPTGTGGSPTPTPSSSPGGGGSTGTTTAPVSFRAKASVRNHKVFLTLRVGGDTAVRVRGTLKRGSKRVRRVSLLARPGRHKLRLPGKRLTPGRYTLPLEAGDIRRTVRFRVRR
jgi:Copper binding proteins, plastocyanin/azurin family